MHLLTHRTLLASALILSSCATPPEQTDAPTIQIPEVWTARTGDKSTPEAWLKDFNSPQLNTIVAEALTNNPSLQAATARLDQALAEAGISRSQRLPSASLGLDGNRQQISTFGPTSTGGVIFENYGLSFDLSWELDLWGRLRDQDSAALAEVQANEAELRGARLSLVAQVAKAWFNYLAASEQVTLAQKTATAYQNNLKTLETRFQRGLSDGLNLRRIRTQAASAQADVANRKRELDHAARSLEQLLGRYPTANIDANTPLPDLPDLIPQGLPADLLYRRPDLVAVERRLAATEKELSASKKERLPKFSLTSSGGSSSDEFQDLLDSDFSVWLLGANLTQPIFQGGRIKANIERSVALRQQAEANYREAALQAFFEVETTLSAEDFLRAEGTQLATAAAEAAQAEALAWKRFASGTAEFIDALDTERTAAATAAQLIILRNRLIQNRIDLYLALGGPFETEP